MSKKSAALEAKFEIAVKTLLKAPKLTVSEAMLVAKFSTKDIADKNMQRNVSRRIPGSKRALHPALLPLSIVDVPPSCLSPQSHHRSKNGPMPTICNWRRQSRTSSIWNTLT